MHWSGLKSTLVSLIAVALAILLWGLASHYKLVTPLLLPSPAAILSTGITLSNEGYVDVPLWQHVLISVARALAAFVVATLIGVPLGLYMGISAMVNALLNPFVQFLRPVPKLALIPLVIVWFGIGNEAAIFSFSASFEPWVRRASSRAGARCGRRSCPRLKICTEYSAIPQRGGGCGRRGGRGRCW